MNRDQFHMQAFVDFLQFAAGDSSMCRQFKNDTGETYSQPTSAIDRMIDDASGRTRKVFERFVIWAADQYGREFLPDDVLKAIKDGPET